MPKISMRCATVLLPLLLLCVQSAQAENVDLATLATASTSYVSPHETVEGMNCGYSPRNSNDKSHGAYGNWPRAGTQWVQYDWPQAISTAKVDIYFFDDRKGVRLPTTCRLLYWNGSEFVPVAHRQGLGLAANQFNTTTFDEISTSRLRVELDSNGTFSTGILAWRVHDTGKSSNFPPVVHAGDDRITVLPAKTYLAGTIRDDGKVNPTPSATWSKDSGPGELLFDDPGSLKTAASFSAPGHYTLKLTGNDGQLTSVSLLHVEVVAAMPSGHLQPVLERPFQITSRLWRDRLKAQIVHWIPHCYDKLNDPNVPEGGIQNLIEAGNKLAGRPFGKHVGPPWANAYVLNVLESMCLAQMLDPQGDAELAAAQKSLRAKADGWVNIVLSAQEPDGYLHTFTTLGNGRRWSNKSLHEGYTAGYFIDAAIAHYLMTGGKDTRMYDAARKMADCWINHIGPPPKQNWYDGHEEIEQSLVRLARLVEQVEGPGKGNKYVVLAKFLIDARGGGGSYDQSQVPVAQQYTAVGHAVRAAYLYSGLTDVAMETGDPALYSASASIWDSLVNRKYYITGGIGSGDTSEGFGHDYSLGNNAYCESCAGCGELFFQHKMQLAFREARYADLMEETLYNAVLGSVDLDGENFTYTNPLDSDTARYRWHTCPCCVGNIPRTLLQLPTWIYSTASDAIYVNQYLGSAMSLDDVAGTSVKLVQTTDYPWSGDVSITVNPTQPAKHFTIFLRVPNRQTSALYTPAPPSDSITSLSVNGSPVASLIPNHGYIAITRDWSPGDKVQLTLPMAVQRVTADARIKGNVGRVALRYGPLIYNLESVDQPVDVPISAGPLTVAWDEHLLDGVMVIKGTLADGRPFQAIPNFARLNRGGRSVVWLQSAESHAGE